MKERRLGENEKGKTEKKKGAGREGGDIRDFAYLPSLILVVGWEWWRKSSYLPPSASVSPSNGVIKIPTSQAKARNYFTQKPASQSVSGIIISEPCV